jgi:hypothetical protein
MASVLTTIKKTVMGNKRVNFGTATLVNGQTSSEIATGLRTVEMFLVGGEAVAYTVSSGTVTFTHSDPGASAGVVGWMAIGY